MATIEWNTVFDAKIIVLNEGEDNECVLIRTALFDDLNALIDQINANLSKEKND